MARNRSTAAPLRTVLRAFHLPFVHARFLRTLPHSGNGIAPAPARRRDAPDEGQHHLAKDIRLMIEDGRCYV